MQAVEHAVLIVSVVTVGAIVLAFWTRWCEREQHTGSHWAKVIASESMEIPFVHALTEYCRRIHLQKDKPNPKDKGAQKKRRGTKKIRLEEVTDFWELAGLFFNRKLRDRVYSIFIDEIREDFIIAQQSCHSRRALCWIKFCFGIRGTMTFLQCLGISFWVPLSKLIPEKIRLFWNLFS